MMRLSKAWLLGRKDLAILLRRPGVVLWIFIMPIAFMFLFASAMNRSGGAPEAATSIPLALVGMNEGGFLLDELIRRLEAQDFAVNRPSNDDDLKLYSRQLIASSPAGEPVDISRALLFGRPVTLTLVLPTNDLAAPHDRLRVARAVYSLAGDLAIVRTRSNGRVVTAEALSELATQKRPLRLRTLDSGNEQGHLFPQAVAGTLIMFTLLILINYGGTLLVMERQEGLLRRLASTPLTRGEVVLGKWMAQMALALCQIGVAIGLGAVVFGASWGPHRVMLLLVILSWAGFCSAFSILLANLARSRTQMTGLGLLISMVMAALGGCWWPPEVSPEWMDALATFIPAGWAMQALRQLAVPDATPATTAPYLIALLLATLVSGWLGARLFRFRDVGQGH
jgi:ABC-type multidrug transport system permease subunit